MTVDLTLFTVHKLNDVGIARAQNIATAFNRLLEALERECTTNTREFSIMKTKLEEASFFAKKSMAINEANQVK